MRESLDIMGLETLSSLGIKIYLNGAPHYPAPGLDCMLATGHDAGEGRGEVATARAAETPVHRLEGGGER